MNSSQHTWKTANLGELCNLQIGKTPARDETGYWGPGHPWLSIADMNQGQDLISTKETITARAVQECRCNLIQPGTLLMSFKLSIGKLGFARVPLYTNEAIVALPIRDPRILDAQFLYYALQNADLLLETDRAVKGQTLNTEKLERIPIPLPPLAEQRRIAAILARADRLRRLRRYALELSAGYLQAVFVELFGDVETNSKDWERCVIDDVLTFSQYGTSQKSNSEKRGYPVLGMGNISYSGDIDLGGLSYVDLSPKEFAKLKLEKGDIIFNRTNSTDLVGKTAHWRYDDIDAVVASYLVRLGLNDQVLPDFFTTLLNTRFYKGLFQSRCKKAVGQSNINPTLLREFPMLTPPLPLQERFAAIARRHERLRGQQREALRQAEQLFGALLGQAFRGDSR